MMMRWKGSNGVFSYSAVNLQSQALIAATIIFVLAALYAAWCQVMEPSSSTLSLLPLVPGSGRVKDHQEESLAPLPTGAGNATDGPLAAGSPNDGLPTNGHMHDAATHSTVVAGGQEGDDPEPAGEAGCPPQMPLLSIVTSTFERLPRLLDWIRYHQVIGFSLFYVFVEGPAAAPDVVAELRKIVGVKVFPPDERRKWWHSRARDRHEWWLHGMIDKTCSGELVERQVYNIEIGINQARVDGAAWIGHIDTDELLYPASSPSLSMHEVLAGVSGKVDSVMFPNYEALAEHDGIQNPLREVSLFKTATAHADSGFRGRHYHDVRHSNPTYFVAYDSGKSLARVRAGLRSNTPHHWHAYDWRHRSSVHSQSGIFHYTFNRPSDIMVRRDRCECPPTKAGAEHCYWLPFDQETHIAASLRNETELRQMFHERLVWDNPTLIQRLRSKGLLQRIHTPSMIMREYVGDPAKTVPRRSARLQAADQEFRDAQGTTAGNFTYADLRPGGAPASCAQFLAEDSSLTVLDLLGPLPGSNDTRDSDTVMVSRMYQYPGLPAAQVV